MPDATVDAPSNIALIKYWGASDLDRVVPCAPSLSMTLDTCRTRTTAHFCPGDSASDEVFLANDDGTLQPAPGHFRTPVEAHLDRLRTWADQNGSFRIATRNSFPDSVGLASSASGFAALTLAALRAMDVRPTPMTCSDLARQSGSGSAARSLWGGFVQWPDADTLAATQIAPASHWDLRDVIAVVATEPKNVPSRVGHERAPSSPFFDARLDHLEDRLDAVRSALGERDMATLGPLVEREGIELHLIAMSSKPAIFYWKPATLAVLEAVRALRADGVAAYATMDAGANVHVLCPPDDEPDVADRLQQLAAVNMVIRDGVGAGPTFDVPSLL